ncbi:hypothetical protein [Hoeflea alexandrii]|uniref:hypothetical protein n=1 Tax=Hoeflea alexandrii TaxID=288436 RepID=UPI0022AF6BBE|nr:hypothetical protein [Hoeflea alexandrii]MCZ4290077.1 hypothetical protein [Hoeflea alexandrii]
MAKKPERKTCFVVGPIGADDSEDRIHADWLLEEIIEPVFLEHFQDFDVTRADKISVPGRIDAQVITHLLESELVIADLTTLNPNAFYEIGIRHTVQKPIIHMHLDGQRIPFDIASFRSIKFETKRPSDLRTARVQLKDAIAVAIDPSHEIDNPVTFSRGRIQVSENATPAERIQIDQLDRINSRLEILERRQVLHSGGEARHRQTESNFVVSVTPRNDASEADLDAALMPIFSNFQGATLSHTKRGTTLSIPRVRFPRDVLETLNKLLGRDFEVVALPREPIETS